MVHSYCTPRRCGAAGMANVRAPAWERIEASGADPFAALRVPQDDKRIKEIPQAPPDTGARSGADLSALARQPRPGLGGGSHGG